MKGVLKYIQYTHITVFDQASHHKHAAEGRAHIANEPREAKEANEEFRLE